MAQADYYAVYNIPKGAQANLTRCLAIEHGKDGIRVNGICPTYAKASLTRTLFDDKDFDQVFTESIPLSDAARSTTSPTWPSSLPPTSPATSTAT